MSRNPCASTGERDISLSLATLFIIPACPCFFSNYTTMSNIQIGVVHNYNHREVTINTSSATNVAEVVKAFMQDEQSQKPKPNPEDIEPIDTSFFGTEKFAIDICEKNLRETIINANSKTEACRNIMTLDTCGYIHIRQYSDARKAELINPYAAPKYVFTEKDFANARYYKVKK